MYIACVFCLGVFDSFVCACMLVLGVTLYPFAFVCCKVPFHATCVCILHLTFACDVLFVSLCLYACFVGDLEPLPMHIARLRFISHVCVKFRRVLLSCCWFV